MVRTTLAAPPGGSHFHLHRGATHWRFCLESTGGVSQSGACPVKNEQTLNVVHKRKMSELYFLLHRDHRYAQSSSIWKSGYRPTLLCQVHEKWSKH